MAIRADEAHGLARDAYNAAMEVASKGSDFGVFLAAMTKAAAWMTAEVASAQFIAEKDTERIEVGRFDASGGGIVYCMDCAWFENDSDHGAWCNRIGRSLEDDYDGFCAWGERRGD